MEEIDPERTAPKLDVHNPRPTPEFERTLNTLSERSRETLNSISLEETLVDDIPSSSAEENVFQKHTNKRQRSNLGESKQRNRAEKSAREPHDLRLINRLFNNLGLNNLRKAGGPSN